MVCKYIVFSKASTCAEGCVYSSAEGCKRYQGEWYLLVTTGTAYTPVYNRFTDPVQRKRLETDVNTEEQGDNWAERRLILISLIQSSLTSVKRLISTMFEPGPQRIRRRGKVEGSFHPFGTIVAVH